MAKVTKITAKTVAESVASRAIRKIVSSNGSANLTKEEKMALALKARDTDEMVSIPFLGTIS